MLKDLPKIQTKLINEKRLIFSQYLFRHIFAGTTHTKCLATSGPFPFRINIEMKGVNEQNLRIHHKKES